VLRWALRELSQALVAPTLRMVAVADSHLVPAIIACPLRPPVVEL
jgi:hypothetical protein